MFFLKTEYEGELQISLLKYSTHLMLMEKKELRKKLFLTSTEELPIFDHFFLV